MLYIHYTAPDGLPGMGELREKEWHVGDKPPNEHIEDEGLQVHTVYADGHELTYIIEHFKNLPYTMKKGRSCVWRGDLARFIFDNL